MPFDASEIFAPSTSTGPRINFSEPVTSQVISGTSGSSTWPASLKVVAQSSASNSSRSSGVIQFKSLGSVGAAFGVAGASDSVAGSSTDSSSVEPSPSIERSPPSTDEVGAPILVSRTARNSSFADALISAKVFSSGTPGMETMMFLSPWVTTCASLTPLASTR